MDDIVITTIRHWDIFIVKVDNIPPLMWPMSRITKVFDGNDNIIRVAQIKTPTGLYNRRDITFLLLHSDRSWSTTEFLIIQDVTQGFFVAVLLNPFKEAGTYCDLSLQANVAGQTATMRATVTVQLLP